MPGGICCVVVGDTFSSSFEVDVEVANPRSITVVPARFHLSHLLVVRRASLGTIEVMTSFHTRVFGDRYPNHTRRVARVRLGAHRKKKGCDVAGSPETDVICHLASQSFSEPPLRLASGDGHIPDVHDVRDTGERVSGPCGETDFQSS